MVNTTVTEIFKNIMFLNINFAELNWLQKFFIVVLVILILLIFLIIQESERAEEQNAIMEEIEDEKKRIEDNSYFEVKSTKKKKRDKKFYNLKNEFDFKISDYLIKNENDYENEDKDNIPLAIIKGNISLNQKTFLDSNNLIIKIFLGEILINQKNLYFHKDTKEFEIKIPFTKDIKIEMYSEAEIKLNLDFKIEYFVEDLIEN